MLNKKCTCIAFVIYIKRTQTHKCQLVHYLVGVLGDRIDRVLSSTNNRLRWPYSSTTTSNLGVLLTHCLRSPGPIGSGIHHQPNLQTWDVHLYTFIEPFPSAMLIRRASLFSVIVVIQYLHTRTFSSTLLPPKCEQTIAIN